MPRRQRRTQARQLDALAEAHDISVLFPDFRPRDEVVEAFAERVALELDPGEPCVPPEIIEEGLLLLDKSERRRIVDDWKGGYPDRWASLCRAVGDVGLTERTVVASAIRGAISERRPIPHGPLVELELESFSGSEWRALALVLAPMLVWNGDEAILASHATAGKRDRSRLEAVYAFAADRVGAEHEERVCRLAERIARRLPFEGLPQASETLEQACEQVLGEPGLAREVACYLLAAYVVVR